jgi:8-oxo-dGTP pyrophosphatase MutT (NUDIX family)
VIQKMRTRTRNATAEQPIPDEQAAQRCAAVAVIVQQRGDQTCVLLLKRAERQGDPWSGQISLPGGRFESSDENLYVTALRETHEETGIDLRGALYHGHAEALHPFSAGPKGMPVTPFLFQLEGEPNLTLSAEATDWFWLPLQSAVAGDFNSSIRFRETTFPSWQYQSFSIWGLTMRILAQFVVD